ncbi:unnamed protein product [Moneuplotes crassus]|uniref:DNA 3'-5' helicase n=1 Tax=Euplotes crassus TaxID=5936 RepID=A0AAD1XIV8_EUPCR|nr:unnamed protein product [Moneuplotes crassus]
MDGFALFKNTNSDSDSDKDVETKFNKIGRNKTPFRTNDRFNRDLGYNHSKQRNASVVNKSHNMPKAPASKAKSKNYKPRAGFYKPVNNLKQNPTDSNIKRNKPASLPSSEEKAGNENQENNDDNWVEEGLEDIDLAKVSKQQTNKNPLCQALKDTMDNALLKMESASRKAGVPINSCTQHKNQSDAKILQPKSGLKDAKKTLNFNQSESSDSKLFNLSATPASAESKILSSVHSNAEVKQFQPVEQKEEVQASPNLKPISEDYEEEKEVSAKPKPKVTKKRAATKASSNFVRINMNKKYQQHSRGVMKRPNKYKKIRNQMREDKKIHYNGAFGGFGKEGLDGAFISEYGIESRIVPVFSRNFTESYAKDEPLEVPSTDQEYSDILKDKFGYDSFFEGQLEAIKSILQGQSTMVVLSTGGGKSLIYQYCSLFMKGLVVVITPLISLMNDQLSKLPPCTSGACFNSQQNFHMKRSVIEALKNDQISVIYMSPEKLVVEDFSRYNQEVSMICIDEIHCSSEWSHNFRPSYLKLSDVILYRLNCNVILGLTATATKDTEKSLVKEYDIKKVIRSEDLSRMNLNLCITRDDEHDKMKNLVTLLKSEDYKQCTSVIIYCTYKYITEVVANYLTQNGIVSSPYHAGMDESKRQNTHNLFNKNRIRCIVCTIAFSMGIDKKDVNSVIHYDMPQSIESYVQEIGRAGRDGNLAKCHLIISDKNYYSLRALLLKSIVDLDVTFKFVSRLMKEIKNVAVDHNVDTYIGRSRVFHDDEADPSNLLLNEDTKEIVLKEPKYVFIPIKEFCEELDIEKEVAMTLFSYLENHYLEKDNEYFIKMSTNIHIILNLRFYKGTPEDLANGLHMENSNKKDVNQFSLFMEKFNEICNSRDGVYKCSVPILAMKLKVPPFEVPRIVYEMQNKELFTFDFEMDSFCIAAYRLKQDIPEISRILLARAKEIEQNSIRKLNSMYIAARKLSFKSIGYTNKVKNEQKKFKEGLANRTSNAFLNVELNLAPEMNNLINKYFMTDNFQEIEHELAGEYGVEAYLPLIRIDNDREKSALESDIRTLLHSNTPVGLEADYDQNKAGHFSCLDIVRILLGVSSKNISLTFFKNNPLWGKYKEHDYNDVMKYAREFYVNYHIEMSSRMQMNETKFQAKRVKMF